MSITVGNVRASLVELRLPWRGCWELRAELQGPAPSGAVVIDWRGWKIRGGKVDPERSGTFLEQGRVVVVGGLGWSTPFPLSPAGFSQADQGLQASKLGQAAALVAGESLQVDSSADRSVGRYWVRRGETTGGAITRLFGRGWYVGLDGVTRVGLRPTPALGAGVDVLTYDPLDGEAVLYAPRPDAAPLGAVVSSPRLPGVRRRIVELIIVATGAQERVRAHTDEAA